MPQMTDPMNALVSLQQALNQRSVFLQPCEIHKELRVLADQPNGRSRITYAKMNKEIVEAVALVVLTEPIEGVPCFQLGYAVIESMRRQKLASSTVAQAVDELRNGMRRQGVAQFYLEAVVSPSNVPSNKLAQRLLSDSPVSCNDVFSGEPALQYLRKVG